MFYVIVDTTHSEWQFSLVCTLFVGFVVPFTSLHFSFVPFCSVVSKRVRFYYTNSRTTFCCVRWSAGWREHKARNNERQYIIPYDQRRRGHVRCIRLRWKMSKYISCKKLTVSFTVHVFLSFDSKTNLHARSSFTCFTSRRWFAIRPRLPKQQQFLRGSKCSKIFVSPWSNVNRFRSFRSLESLPHFVSVTTVPIHCPKSRRVVLFLNFLLFQYLQN